MNVRVLVLSDGGGIWKTTASATLPTLEQLVGSWTEPIQLARDTVMYVSGDTTPGPRRMINWNATQLVRDHISGWTGRIVGTAVVTGINAHGALRDVPERYTTASTALDRLPPVTDVSDGREY